jgi:lipoprotein-anchoring transpeptidase ErfK/SrfK
MNSFSARLSLTIGLALVLCFSTVKFYTHVGAQVEIAGLDYAAISSPGFMRFEPKEKKTVEVVIQNVSSSTWDKGMLALTTSYSTGDLNRPSVWQGNAWQNDTTIRPVNTDNIQPGKKARFVFELAAPQYAGLYKEYFKLTADGFGPLGGDPVIITVQVGNPIIAQAAEPKEIRVYKNSQQSNLIENGYIVATLAISSGKAGYVTPTGTYRVMNKFTEAYSQKYKLYMGNWMGLITEKGVYEGYGLHSLAYWKTKKPLYPDGTIKDGRLYEGNKVYEDALHLGTPMSHGCVRYGVEESGVLFGWAEVGTLVKVI